MEQQFAEQIKNMLEDIELVLNHHIVLGDEEYKSCVMIVIDAFHTAIYADTDNYLCWYRGLMDQNITKLDFQDFIRLTRVTSTDFIRMYCWLVFDSFYVEENILFTERQRIIFGNLFKRSQLKEELMATLWHPNNFNHFIHWDPETFLF